MLLKVNMKAGHEIDVKAGKLARIAEVINHFDDSGSSVWYYKHKPITERQMEALLQWKDTNVTWSGGILLLQRSRLYTFLRPFKKPVRRSRCRVIIGRCTWIVDVCFKSVYCIGLKIGREGGEGNAEGLERSEEYTNVFITGYDMSNIALPTTYTI